MSFDEFGIWNHDLKNENGDWLIGPDLGHPGHLASDDPRRLMVKYWLASQQDRGRRYLGLGHQRHTPAHFEGSLEGVQCYSGCLYWQTSRQCTALTPSLIPNEAICQKNIELDHLQEGFWHLYESRGARGVTIVRPKPSFTGPFGSGKGYEFNVLDSDHNKQEDWTDYLIPKILKFLNQWTQSLFMVFRGRLRRYEGHKLTHKLDDSLVNSCAFVPATDQATWVPDPNQPTTVAVVSF